MAILKILTEGDETLRKTSRPVKDITPRIKTLLDDMLETMREADGAGIAAVQVGVLRRIVVIETEHGDVIELINPKIIDREGEQEEVEGCLSLPGKCGITHRPMTVTVEATDRNGKTFTRKGSGLLARAFCHELDHLDGILFSDNALHMLSEKEIDELYSDDKPEK